MRIVLSARAEEDLESGYWFYEKQSPGLGSYFLDTLLSDIDSLHLHAGIHRVLFGSHRSLSKRFPFAIYYRIESDTILIRAVFDNRQRPSRIRRRLKLPDEPS